VLQWLLAFRPGLSFVGSEVRAGGPLQYATIASMYLEIVFALGLGVLLAALDARRLPAAAAAGLGLLIVAEAITLTFTRTGLVMIAASLALVGTLRLRQRGVDRGVRVLVILSVLILGMFVTSRSTQAMWLRLTTAGQDTWYRAVVEAPAELTLATGTTTAVPLRVTNTGRLSWDSRADPPIYFSYHWLLSDADRVVVFEGVRTPFDSPVAPQTTRSVDAVVRVPLRPGQYRLAWDVVEEGRLWFSTEPGGILTSTRVAVSGPLRDAAAAFKTTPLPRPAVRPGRLFLWRAAASMLAAHPLFGVGADNFRLLYGSYSGLADADTRTHSNNMYIEVLVGGGLAAGLSLVWLLWRAARLFADRVRLTTAGHSSDGFGVAAAGAAIFLHGLVDSFLSFTPTNILIAVTLGLAAASTRGAETGQNADRV
jgi:O-antigen ligase/polysaccharide polymerase Wzy-like membrane protein